MGKIDIIDKNVMKTGMKSNSADFLLSFGSWENGQKGFSNRLP
ncbi:MAG: hypothetical protein PHX21_07880 [bacterium]|nr:hypothetical protein [bacterium]